MDLPYLTPPMACITGLGRNYITVARQATDLKIECSFFDHGILVPCREKDFIEMISSQNPTATVIKAEESACNEYLLKMAS